MTSFERVAFGAVLSDVSAGSPKVPQASYLKSGRFAVVDQGHQAVSGFTDDESMLSRAGLPVLVFGDHTRRFKYMDQPFAVGADGVKLLRPSPDLDTRFAYWYLSSVELPTAGYSRHFKFLKTVTVPLPSLPEQRRIADILDRANELRTKRRRALVLLDELLDSTFIDMFGDPALNPRGWQSRAVGTLASKYSDGPFGSNLKSSDYVSDGVRVIRLQNIGVGDFVDKDRAFVSAEHFSRLYKHECVPGDVLIGTMGDPNLRACLQPEDIPVALNKADCVQLRPDRTVSTGEWVVGLLNQPSVARMAQSLIMGQTRARISMGRLRGLQVPVPPLKLQQQYSGRVLEIRSVKAGQIAHLAKLDELFLSVQHRAFDGSL